jgi:hypothetical protein
MAEEGKENTIEDTENVNSADLQQEDSTVDSEVKSKDTDTSVEEIYDINALPEELQPLAKKLQASFTKKMQKLSGERQKIEVYDQFAADPVGTMKRLAKSYGYDLKELGASDISSKSEDETVEQWLEKRLEDKLSRVLQPYAEKLGKIEESTFKTYLDTFYPDWYDYEDQMVDLLRKHPTLRNDIDTLYQLATIDKVESKTIKETIESFKKKKDNIVDANKQSTANVNLEPSTERRMSLKEAMQLAKKQIST